MKFRPFKIIYLYFVLAFSVSLSLYFYIYHIKSKKTHQPSEQTISINVAHAVLKSMPLTRYASGTVKSLATANVRALANGQLKKINFVEGKMVKQGEILAEIDDRPYLLALNKARGQWVSSQAQLTQARNDLKRFKLLLKQDSLTQQEYDKQIALVADREGTLASQQAEYAQAKLNWQHTRLKAPISGQAGIRQVELGNYMQLSDNQGLVSIIQLTPISIIFTLPETDLPLLTRRLNEQAEFIVSVYARDQSKLIATGKVVAIDNQVDDATGTIKLRAMFDNDQHALFPNQFVNVNLLLDKIKNVVVIPTAAVQIGEKGHYVYLVSTHNKVNIRYVDIGFSNGEQVIITNGLKAGDTVAINGINRLSENAIVRPISKGD